MRRLLPTLMLAALVAGPQLLRRPATPPAPPQVVPTVVQAPAPAFDAPAERPAPPTASTDNERQPNIRRAAIAACEGKAIFSSFSCYLP